MTRPHKPSELARLSELDREYVLHPFTRLRAYSAGELGDACMIAGGSGVWIRDTKGVDYLDAFGGLYCVTIGYGRQEVAEAIYKQARDLAYYHTYASHSTEVLIELSARLVQQGPGSMEKVFFGLSGSDANETQAKLVWYYHNAIGKPKKKKIIACERGYHGCTVVAGSLTGMSFYHDGFDLPVPAVVRAGSPYYYRDRQPGESEEAFSLRRAEELEELILREDPGTVGAFIAEPVLGTGGLVPPPRGYWSAIQEVLRRHEILLIADEVVTGFGRTGVPFGSHLYEIEPDLVTVAKGLTSAYVPLSAALVGSRVAAALEEASDRLGAFSHGYTYSGHPLGAAAAHAVLDIVDRERLVENAADVGAYFHERMRERFEDHPFVGDVRGVGLLAALEFVADRGTRRLFPPSAQIGARVSSAAREQGLIARAMPHGDILGFAPPLVISRDEIDQVVEMTASAIDAVLVEMEQAADATRAGATV